MRLAAQLLIGLLATGCYLSHGRDDGPGPPDTGVPDTGVVDSRDAGERIDATSRRDAGRPPGCTPVPPAVPRPPPPACAGPRPPGGTTRTTLMGSGPALGTDGCDVWGALGPTYRLLALDRAGLVRELETSALDGIHADVIATDPSELTLVVESLTSVSLQERAGAFGPPRVIADDGRPRLLAPEPLVHRATARTESRTVIGLRTDAPSASWVFDTSWDEPIQLSREMPSTMPRLCRAGLDRVVAVWVDGITARGAVVDGDLVVRSDLGPAGPSSMIDVDCTPDGRALAVWSEPDGTVVTSHMDAIGCWAPGGRMPPGGPGFTPHVWILGEAALLTWAVDGGQSFVYALTDLEGTPTRAPVLRPDFDGDGAPDRLMRACARPDSFALLTQSRRPAMGRPAPTGWLTIVGRDGEPSQRVNLGPYGNITVAVDLVCDRHGRVTAFWSDMGQVLTSWTDGI